MKYTLDTDKLFQWFLDLGVEPEVVNQLGRDLGRLTADYLRQRDEMIDRALKTAYTIQGNVVTFKHVPKAGTPLPTFELEG